jgi:hypothetical protein
VYELNVPNKELISHSCAALFAFLCVTSRIIISQIVQLDEVIMCVCPDVSNECTDEGGVCVDNCGSGKEGKRKRRERKKKCCFRLS